MKINDLKMNIGADINMGVSNFNEEYNYLDKLDSYDNLYLNLDSIENKFKE